MRLRRHAGRSDGKRILFATDIHGSEQCFRKFLNAGSLYDATYLILGGDITGKFLVPVVRTSKGTFDACFGEHAWAGLDEAGVEQVMKTIRRAGAYPVVGSADELAALEDAGERERMFRQVVYDSVADWVSLAEERLRGTGRRLFVAPGNDDFFDIDGALQGSDVVVFAENECVRLDETHEMITTGYSNPTPWVTERELPETDLKRRIMGMVAHVEDPSCLIAVLHPPPYASDLDSAPQLDEDFNLSVRGGDIAMTAVGSTAVREFIEEVQPLLGLHGHVHEAQGSSRIGRTLCVNPGSEYTEGVLSAAIVRLAEGAVRGHQFIAG